MGQNARRKRQRASESATTSHEGAADGAAAPERSHHLRMILLATIPVVSIGGAVALVQLLDSRPAAGMLLILGCALWIIVFASDIGGNIPRRDRTRSSGLGFGRNS